MCSQRKLMFDVAGVVGKRTLDSVEQLFGLRKSVLQGMPDLIRAAQAEQMLSRRIEIGNARFLIQQNDCSGKMFQCGEKRILHTHTLAENMPNKSELFITL